MDQLLIQRTRYLLRSRFRRVQTTPKEMLVHSCAQLMNWLNSHPVLYHSALVLSQFSDKNTDLIAKTLAEAPEALKGGGGSYNPGRYASQTNLSHASVCFHIIRAISQLGDLNERNQEFLFCNFAEFFNGDGFIEADDAVTLIKDIAVDGLFEYFDEHFDQRNAIYSILLKYKQRSEWFRSNRLREHAEVGLEGKRGEPALAIDVQEYILDQGVEFFIEPASGSGETDFLLRYPEGGYFVIDAKYIPSDAANSAISKKLADGFHQVSRYCNDFNEPNGYLVVFNCSKKRIKLDLENSDGFPYINIGGCLVYYLEIRIADEPSASKSGKVEEIVIDPDKLLKSNTKKRR